MTEVTFQIPSEVREEEARLFLMMKLYELGKISLGKAAELSGYSKALFMEILGKHNVSVINYSADDLENEMNL